MTARRSPSNRLCGERRGDVRGPRNADRALPLSSDSTLAHPAMSSAASGRPGPATRSLRQASSRFSSNQITDFPDDASPLRRRHPWPGSLIECLACGADGCIDIRRLTGGRQCDGPTGARIEYFERLAALRGDPPTIDQHLTGLADKGFNFRSESCDLDLCMHRCSPTNGSDSNARRAIAIASQVLPSSTYTPSDRRSAQVTSVPPPVFAASGGVAQTPIGPPGIMGPLFTVLLSPSRSRDGGSYGCPGHGTSADIGSGHALISRLGVTVYMAVSRDI